MKKNIVILGLAGLLGLSSGLTSCGADYETDFNVEKLVVPDRSQAPILFPRTGGTHEILVESNVPMERWKVLSNADWCTVTPQKDKVIVSATENTIFKHRKGEVTVAYGHQSYSINVTQMGYQPEIFVGEEQLNEGLVAKLDPTLTTYSLPVKTNLNIDNVIVPDTCSWVHFSMEGQSFQKVREAGDVKEYNLTFNLDQNTDTVARYCTVILQSSQNYNYTSTFVFKQLQRGYIVEVEDQHKVIEVKAMGETITVPFKVNGPAKAYTFEILGDAKEWIIPAAAARAMRPAEESFVIKPNTAVEETPRSGKIRFTSTDPAQPNSFEVTVNQAGFVAVPPLNVQNATFVSKPGQILLQWETPENVDYTKLVITYRDVVTKEDKEVVITDYKVNSALIGDTYACAGEYTFTFTTYGPTGKVTETPVIVKATSGEAPAREKVQLRVNMLSANATQPGDGGGLPHLVDGQVTRTNYYHTFWDRAINEEHRLDIALDTPLQDLCFEYSARMNGKNNGGDVRSARIEGSNNGKEWELMGTEEFNLPTENGGLGTAKNTISGRSAYKHIRFVPLGTRQINPLKLNTRQAWWNMSEIYLYRIRHDEAWAQQQLGK